MDLLRHDILIVGGGGAGLRAAIAIGEENPRFSVGVVSKVYPMRSHTVSAEGGAAAVIKANDSLDDHARDTITGSDWLADQDAVELFVKEAPAEMIQLEHWGCPWSREPNGQVAVRPFGGMKIGDGMALAYRAGAPLKDMEFVQYHPTGLPGTGILITEAARGEGGVLVNKDGYRYLQDYNLGQPVDIHDPQHPQKATMELGPRDRLSQAFIKERQKGRTLPGPYGDVIHLDVRHLGEKKINKKIPFVLELARNYIGIDPVFEPIPVRPVVHYMMAGVSTNIDAATVVPGLFAPRQSASLSINRANRLA